MITIKKFISNKYLVLFVLTVLLGAFLRLWRLNAVPISLFGDEIDVGLQAKSILVTGKDYLSFKYPVMFRSFAEYRLPLQLYLAVPFIKVFGLNEWGVRLPSAMMGIVSLVLFYFLSRKLFNSKIASISTIFLSISPWALQFSRQANDASFILPLLLLGILMFLKGLKNYNYLVFSTILFSLSFYSYATASVFVPIFVMSLLILYKREIFKYGFQKLSILALICLVILYPYIKVSFSGSSTKRFSDISINSENEIARKVDENRKWSNSPFARVYYNKVTVFFDETLKQYLSAFSTTFLFTDGDSNPRHSVDGFGELYHFDFLLVLLGIFASIKFFLKATKKGKKKYLIVLFWILIAPIPSSLTKEGANHAARLILLMPPLLMLSAMGLEYILSFKKDFYLKAATVLLLLYMAFDIGRYFHKYYVAWANESWIYWGSGYKEMLTYVKEIDSEYSEIYINNTYEPALGRFLFWYDYDMSLFQKQFTGDEHIENIAPGLNGFMLGNRYYFGDLQKPIENLVVDGRLIAASAENDITNPAILENNPHIRLLKTFYSPDGTPIFYVIDSNQPDLAKY